MARAAEPPPAFSCGHGQSDLCHKLRSVLVPAGGWTSGLDLGQGCCPPAGPGTGVGSFPGAQAQPGPQGSRVDPPGALETLKVHPGASWSQPLGSVLGVGG